MTSDPNLMFRISTGKIVKYNAHLYNSSGEYLQMYKGWTPYFTIEGDYIGCHIGGYYMKPDKRYVRLYWELNR